MFSRILVDASFSIQDFDHKSQFVLSKTCVILHVRAYYNAQTQNLSLVYEQAKIIETSTVFERIFFSQKKSV